MDSLALLCTLHADGPATLKRLRACGCGSISALVARTPDEIGAELGIEGAVARRLLREARILAERVGADSLDIEETPLAMGRSALPPVPQKDGIQKDGIQKDGTQKDLHRETSPSTASITDHQPEPSVLDAADRALVAHVTQQPSQPAALGSPEPIVGGSAAPTAGSVDTADDPFASMTSEAPTEESAARLAEAIAPTVSTPGAESFGSLPVGPEGAEGVADALPLTGMEGPPASMPVAISQEPVVEPVVEAVSLEGSEPLDTALPTGGSLGLDGSMVEDLAAMGVTSLAELGAADTLGLTRGLGITFAQARRLRFLARREGASGAAPAPSVARSRVAPVAAPGPVPTPEAAPESVPELEAAPAPGAEAPRGELTPFTFDGRSAEVESDRSSDDLGMPVASAGSTRGPEEDPETDPEEEYDFEALAETVERPADDFVIPAGKGVAQPFGAGLDRSQPAPADVAQGTVARPSMGQATKAAPSPEPTAGPQAEPAPTASPKAEPKPASAVPDAAPEPERTVVAGGRLPSGFPVPAEDPEQGVRVDPKEIAARPRFGDRFAAAQVESEPTTLTGDGRTVLGWNFEIPRPESESLPFTSVNPAGPGGRTPVESSAGEDPSNRHGDETAGPFA